MTWIEGKNFSELSESEKQAALERWRKEELPALRRQAEEGFVKLRQFAYGDARRRPRARA